MHQNCMYLVAGSDGDATAMVKLLGMWGKNVVTLHIMPAGVSHQKLIPMG